MFFVWVIIAFFSVSITALCQDDWGRTYRFIDPVSGKYYISSIEQRDSKEEAKESLKVVRRAAVLPTTIVFPKVRKSPKLKARKRTVYPTPQESFRAIFISDTQVEPKVIIPHREVMLDYQPDVILHGGDLVHESDDQDQWKRFFDVYASLLEQVPLLAAFGDHEFKSYYDEDLFGWAERAWWTVAQFTGNIDMLEGSDSSEFFSPASLQNRRFYGVTRVGPVQIYVLDSIVARHTHGETDADPRQNQYLMGQKKWLEETLKQSQNDSSILFRFAMFHWPAFGANDYQTDSDFSVLANPSNDEYMFRDIVPILEQYSVNLVLSGHLHKFESYSLPNPKSNRQMAFIIAGPAGGRFLTFAQKRADADEPRNFSEDAKELPSSFSDSERERFARIQTRRGPYIDTRTITFIETRTDGAQTRLKIYTCAFDDKGLHLIDEFSIHHNGSLAEQNFSNKRLELPFCQPLKG